MSQMKMKTPHVTNKHQTGNLLLFTINDPVEALKIQVTIKYHFQLALA